jgi:hypothetical protein
MSALEKFELPELVQLEQLLNGRMLVFAASALDMELLPTLYNTINTLPEDEELYVLLYGRGGEINAARRVAILLKERFKHVHYVIPYYCQSSFTTMALSGNTLFTGPMSCFSPIDTHLQMLTENDDGPNILASEDIKHFSTMAKEWFGLNSTQDSESLFASVVTNIFPTTLTSLYRSIKEQSQIAHELISFNQSVNNEQLRKSIVDTLMFEYHSHSYALTGKNLANIGLNVVEDNKVFSLAWSAVNRITNIIGGQARTSPEDPRNDCLVMTSRVMYVRQNIPHAFSPYWHKKEF